MVSLRLHRLGVSVFAESPTRVGVSREALEAAVEEGGAQPLRLHRLGVSVFAKSPAQPAVQRESFEAAIEEGGAQPLRLHRLGVSVFAQSPPRVSVQRESFEAAIEEGGAQPLRLHRLGVSVFMRVSLPQVEPLPLADGIAFFLHNWTSDCEIETSYLTTVDRSPGKGSEERLSLAERPARALTLRWLRDSAEEALALKKLLRQMTEGEFQIPLYPDALIFEDALAASASITATGIGTRRYHVGARVALFRNTETFISEADVLVRTIQSLTPTSMTFTEVHGQDLSRWAVVPLIDCEIVLSPRRRLLAGGNSTREVNEVSLTVQEVRGKSALPPLAVGLPDGWPVKLGYPVFEIAPDWSTGIDIAYDRDGSVQRIGRRNVPVVEGERYRQVHDWPLRVTERDDWKRVASFFDSRLGRAGAFWVIDKDWSWTMISNTANTIFIEPNGDFDSFAECWTDESCGVGIVMKDGTVHLAQVFSVTDNGSTWRLTLQIGQSVTSSLTVADIDRVAVARLSRFDSDALDERWRTSGVCDMIVTTRELHYERDVDLDTEAP